ncbi:MAG TPA: diaminopimelate decarboxylase [Saccharofermentans sp.]|nr:diaminopimelate decarboxylase [Saccharofermentans sp.]
MNSYIESTSFFGNVSAEELATKYGTPLYVYNERILRNSMRTVSKLIQGYRYVANYSMKANSNLSILKIVNEEGLNADAMSEGEIRLLMKAGFSTDRIFFVPNNVSSQEMQFAIDNGILVSLDSLDQLERYGNLDRGGRCAIRINPGVGAGHHSKVVTAGKNTKFAISRDDIDEALEIAARHELTIVGINQHVGSLFMDPEPFLQAVSNLLSVAQRFGRLEFIDFGGGYGVPYHKLDNEQSLDFENFEVKFKALVDEFVSTVGYTPLFKTEPGRYVCCEGGVLLGRVHATKDNAGRKYAGTDIGMNVLARPAIYDAWHDIEVIRNSEIITDGDLEKVTLVGNICETGDIIADDRLLPKIKTEDLVCVLDAGAYGYSMSSNYNCRLRPAEVLITENGDDKLIRRRENYDDLFSSFEL